MKGGSSEGEFRFSADTVARASAFYERVRRLPYTRPVPLQGISELVTEGGGWPIRFSWIQALPAWLRAPRAGNSLWKWIAVALVLGLVSVFLYFIHRLSLAVSSERPFLQALAQFTVPIFVLAAAPTLGFSALAPINMRWGTATAIELAMTAVMFLSGAWLAWRAAPVIAEAIIASPRIAPESVDAYLVRISMRLLGLAAAAGLLSIGADRLGVPVYGIIAGLGVGGLAIALAAQPTVENLIGSLSLFADKPIRVGDFCRYGDTIGTVEAIGIRSTRIRGIDRPRWRPGRRPDTGRRITRAPVAPGRLPSLPELLPGTGATDARDARVSATGLVGVVDRRGQGRAADHRTTNRSGAGTHRMSVTAGRHWRPARKELRDAHDASLGRRPAHGGSRSSGLRLPLGGPGHGPRDRQDYVTAVGDSRNEQLLLNIVKLR